MTTSPSDNDGTAKGLPSDDAAFVELFTVYFGTIYRYVRAHVKTDEAALDVVHLVFYRIWTRQVVLAPHRQPLPYLYILARCALIDYFRHKQTESRPAHPDRQAPEPDEPAPP